MPLPCGKNQRVWAMVRNNAMAQDFSWKNAAAQYRAALFKHFKLIIQWIDSLFEIIAFEGGIFVVFFVKKLKICAIFLLRFYFL